MEYRNCSNSGSVIFWCVLEIMSHFIRSSDKWRHFMSAHHINSAKCPHIWQNSRGNDKWYFPDKIWTLYYIHTDIIRCIVTERSRKQYHHRQVCLKITWINSSVSANKSQIFSTKESRKILICVVFVSGCFLFLWLHTIELIFTVRWHFSSKRSRLSCCWTHFFSPQNLYHSDIRKSYFLECNITYSSHPAA